MSRESLVSLSSLLSLVSQECRDTRDSRDTRDTRDSQDSRDTQDSQDTLDSRYLLGFEQMGLDLLLVESLVQSAFGGSTDAGSGQFEKSRQFGPAAFGSVFDRCRAVPIDYLFVRDVLERHRGDVVHRTAVAVAVEHI